MRRTFFKSCFFSGILLAAQSTLRADQTNAPVKNSPGIRPQFQNGPSGQNAGIAGFSLGGPVGVLNDQQRASYQVAMKGVRGKLMELEAKLRVARQDLLTTSVTEKFNENIIRQKALAAAQIEAEMTVLRVKAFTEVTPPLSPEQIEKVIHGQSGPIHPLERPALEHGLRGESPVSTNHDDNGLPPKH